MTATANHILIPVSAGELLDKKTILEIKSVRLQEPSQLANVRRELALLASSAQELLAVTESAVEVTQLESELRKINEGLWDLENTVRALEQAGQFDERFMQAARTIYANNDRRAAIKKQINILLKSSIVEEKSHRLS